MGAREPKSKIEENSFVECNMKNCWPKNGSILSRNKKRSDLKEHHNRQTEIQTYKTDRVNDKK